MSIDEDVTTPADRVTLSGAPDGATTHQQRVEAALDQALAFVPAPTYLGHAVRCDRCERRLDGGHTPGVDRAVQLAAAQKLFELARRQGWRLDDDGDLCAVCAAREARQECACGAWLANAEHPTTCRRFGAETLDQLEAASADNYGDPEYHGSVILDLAAEIRRLDKREAILRLEIETIAAINQSYSPVFARMEALGGDLLKIGDDIAVARAVRAERERLRDWHKQQAEATYYSTESAASAHRDAAESIQATIDETEKGTAP